MIPLTLVDVVAWAASIATVGMFGSSTGNCWRIYQTESTGSVAYLPFLAGVINCVLWMSYGYLREDSTILLVNMAGLGLNTVYIVVFLKYTQQMREVTTRCGLALAFVLTVFVYVFVLEGDQTRGMNTLGIMCNGVAIAFFAAPLATMNEVITTRSTETMSLPLSSMSAVTTFLWVVYGVLQWDFYVIAPNALGLLLSCIQLLLFIVYWQTPRKRVVSLDKPI